MTNAEAPKRWRQFLFPPRPDLPSQPRDEPVARKREQPQTVSVPCASGAFSFDVTVHERWARRGDRYDLEAAISEHAETLRAQTNRTLRGISWRYQPEDSAGFERAANVEVGKSWGFANDPSLSCVIAVCAVPGEELRGELKNSETKRLEADARRQEAARELEHLDTMRARWLAFLRQSDGDPLGSLAIRLAGTPDPDKVAEIIAKHMSDKEKAVDEIRGACATASQAYQDKDLYDFAMSMDSPLSRLVGYVSGEREPHGEGTSATNGAQSPA